MKLKLDLHPIYNDSRAIDAALQGIMDEATQKRTTELEIITGKGSGQLKKSVLRFLDQPEIRARYHRVEKDGDNWGRLFVHFRWERLQAAKAVALPPEVADYQCFCCQAVVSVPVSAEALGGKRPGRAHGRMPRLRLAEPPEPPAGPARDRADPGRVRLRGRVSVYTLVHLPTGRAVATLTRAEGWWAKGWGVLGRRALAPGGRAVAPRRGLRPHRRRPVRSGPAVPGRRLQSAAPGAGHAAGAPAGRGAGRTPHAGTRRGDTGGARAGSADGGSVGDHPAPPLTVERPCPAGCFTDRRLSRGNGPRAVSVQKMSIVADTTIMWYTHPSPVPPRGGAQALV